MARAGSDQPVGAADCSAAADFATWESYIFKFRPVGRPAAARDGCLAPAWPPEALSSGLASCSFLPAVRVVGPAGRGPPQLTARPQQSRTKNNYAGML